MSDPISPEGGRPVRDGKKTRGHASVRTDGSVRVEGLGRRFGDKWVVDDVSFDVPSGDFLSIVGPSGCGKSTTLRLLAGLDRPDSGEISIGGRVVSSSRGGVSIPSERRNIGFVFQSYALWPHLTVFEHAAYPLSKRSISRSELRKKVDETLAIVGLDGLRARYPSELSGGQQQRVALARAVVKEPATLLLDEPLSNLDTELRGKTARELRNLQQRLGFTAIYVTHDRVEALSLSDRVMVMNQGRAVDFGTPSEIYEHPRDLFAAKFVSGANTLPGEVISTEGTRTLIAVRDTGSRLEAPVSTRADRVAVGDQVFVATRPEAIRICTDSSRVTNVVEGLVESVTYFGAFSDVLVTIGSVALTARVEPSHVAGLEVGHKIKLSLPSDSLVVLRDDGSSSAPIPTPLPL